MGRSGGLNCLYNLTNPMEALLLTTKLSPPVIRGNLIHRPRLVGQLQSGWIQEISFTRKLTLISAPAGYGKTSLAAEWLAACPYPTAWLSLDETDNDPRRFLAYLLAAFQQINPNLGGTASAMLQAPQPPPVEIALTSLLNDIVEEVSPLILVLDDYHSIHNQTIHKLVAFLLERQPPDLHLVILTREDPLLPVSRYLARNQAIRVPQDELRFTTGETSEFLSRTMGLELKKDEIEELQQRTEGWIAGLQLVALSLQDLPDRHEFIAAFAASSRFVLDYLFEEVFERQPDGIQDFLLKTSLLERLTADLCDQIAGRSDSAGLLESLERSNLFIVPVDTARVWYRYHHLFQELLRHRLLFQGTAEVNRLHTSASQWFEARGFLAEAIEHALAAKDWGLSSRLIQQASGDMLTRGEISTLLSWFERIPGEIVRADPGLSFTCAWPLILAGQLELAEALLGIAESAAQDDPPFLGAVLTAQSNLARMRGDLPRTIDLSRRALDCLPESDLIDRSLLALNLGLAYWHTGQNNAAEKALLEAQRTAQACGNVYALLTATIFLGRVHAVRGELHQAAGLYRAAVQKGGQVPILAIAHLDLAALYYEWNELEACRTELQLARGLNQYGGNAEVQAAIELTLARLEFAQGDLPATEAVFTGLRQIEDTTNLPASIRRRIRDCQADLALRRGDLKIALSLIETIPPDLDAHPFYRFLGLTTARLALAQGQKGEASHLLAESYTRAEREGWGYGALAVRVLQALAADTQETALTLLTDALQRSQPDGFVRLYADSGRDLIPLLQEAARHGVHSLYVGEILAAIGNQASPKAGRLIESAAGLVEALSPRELEVLRLMAAGLSNREIAVRLVVSPGTVKTHVHHICGKLGVSNRTQAVVKARDIKII